MMKKKNYLPYCIWIFFIVFIFQIQGCDSSKVDYYNGNRALYFEREQFVISESGSGSYVRLDTVSLNLSYYPGINEVRHPFKIRLIGNVLSEDTEYAMMKIDSLSTAKEEMVSLPDRLLFKKGVVVDSLWVTIHKDKVETGGEYYVTYKLIENENFTIGYTGYTMVKVRFNNLVQAPLWWDEDIVNIFLGEWSQEKFETLVQVTGLFTFEGLSETEKRKYSLQLKEYIEENNLPMTVPVY